MTAKNVCTFVGRIGQDPEQRFTPGGMAVLNAGLAVASSRKKADGEYIKTTTWVDLTWFGKSAENATTILKKGDLVAVTAEYRKDKRETDDGTRYYHSFVVQNWDKLASAKNNGDDAEPMTQVEGASDDTPAPAAAPVEDEFPF